MANNHHLMFHLTWQELERFPSGIMIPNDGIVFAHHGISPVIEHLLDKYRANTATIYRYLQCFTFPVSYPEDVSDPKDSWIGGGNWWFDYLHMLRTKHRCYYTDQLGKPIRYRFSHQGIRRVIINWKKVYEVLGNDMRKMAQFIRSSVHPKDRIFFDDFFPRLAEWMFFTPEEYMAAKSQEGGGELSLLRGYLQESQPTLTNGLDYLDPPHYLEHSEWDWETSLNLWRKNEHSVLSVDPSQVYWVDRAIKTWDELGGWLAFAGSGDTPETRQRAYQLANEARGVEFVVRLEDEPN